ncbi:ATP-binding protein [Aquimarina sp. AD1]|uniref:AAA family ATPase n=1 Tax=Aquimarina sp. (strain AD1) TaxID=1714848 RepID=UPI000E48D548|nr:ATP-binding protein [Aquimarina sp. AD1]AXT55387.1 ATP-binding protein [Aquimarina sp. AD1]RKN28713.1 ATP-binding protein [Aquimarina sp. AD1]
MRLKEIHIKGTYKNLSNFNVALDGISFLEVFVGKNGTGKSNFFEAILEIFKHLSEEDYPITFNYAINYEIDEETIYLEWKDIKWIDQEKQDIAPDKTKLPENILVYYSGHNKTIGNLLYTSNEKHKSLLDNKRKNINLLSEVTRRFTGIDAQYKSLLLSALLLQEDTNKAKTFIKDKLGIASIGNEIRIDFKRPEYASDKGKFEFDEFDNDKRFWSPEGYFKSLLNQIWEVGKNATQFDIRNEGKINEDEYILFRGFTHFQESFNNYTPLELFIAFDNLKTIGYLDDIKINVTLTSGKEINIDQFSDGQFQSIYIYALTELFKDKNCITLLDEPDSFLHPEWQHKFLNQVYDISDKSAKTNHVLMSSHSAVTLVGDQEKRVNLFRFHENNLNCHKVGKNFAVNQLSSQLFKVNYDKQILSIMHTHSQDKPILFTEGFSDPIVLYEAWNKLYDIEIPFDISFGFGCEYLRKILTSDKFQSEMNGKPIFGLFDFDEAYNHWNSLKTDGVLIENDPFKGICKKVTNKNSYAFLIPIPEKDEIKRQVIKVEATKETYKHESKVEMEHLFYSDDTKEKFNTKNSVGGAQIIEISDSAKMEFAQDIIPVLEKEHFEILKPMFDLILTKV